MPSRRTRPITFRPKGCSDTIDATNAFPGALIQAANLVPSPSTNDMWVPRPAAVTLTTFGSLPSPGFQSGMLVVGDIMYGMIASALNPGNDQPFAYNLATNTFLTVTGITAANTPASPSPTGDWTPPILAAVGTRIIVTHPGFPGGAIKFGWFDIGAFSDAAKTGSTHSSTTLDTLSANVLAAGWQPGMLIAGAGIPSGTTIVSIAVGGLSLVLSQAATATAAGVALTVTGGTPVSPQWAAGDTDINPLPSVPVGVAQFNGRAYYACGVNGIPFSDSLLATSRTNANQALTTNDGLAVTALGALPLSSLLGGIVQAIIVFEGSSKMQQITGDPATTNLAINSMPVATGTLAPLSITSTNFGLAFVSPEGVRIVSFEGAVSDPIGDHGSGISVPFIYAVNPSRICAAANADVLRISVKNGQTPNQTQQAWWFDIARKVWSGPHTFAEALVQPWRNTFVATQTGVNATLFRSDVIPTANSSYVEGLAVMAWALEYALLPSNADMHENGMFETSVALSIPDEDMVSIYFANEAGSILDNVTIQGVGSSPLWGTAIWGAFVWGPFGGFLRQYPINWHKELVFKQGFMLITGQSVFSLAVGNTYMRVRDLGYQMQALPGSPI